MHWNTLPLGILFLDPLASFSSSKSSLAAPSSLAGLGVVDDDEVEDALDTSLWESSPATEVWGPIKWVPPTRSISVSDMLMHCVLMWGCSSDVLNLICQRMWVSVCESASSKRVALVF